MSNRKATPDVLGALLGDTGEETGGDIGGTTDAPPRAGAQGHKTRARESGACQVTRTE
ncbi:MAG: hypothetical protein R2851_19320 [Caldilineaceae bacterium]